MGISPDREQGDGGPSRGWLQIEGERGLGKAKGDHLTSPRTGFRSEDGEPVDELLDKIDEGGPSNDTENIERMNRNPWPSAQRLPEVPPERIKGSVQLLNGLFIGDRQSSIDGQYLRNNQICRIINTFSSQIKNIFDPAEMSNSKIKEYIQKKPQSVQRLVGQIQYMNFDWREKLTISEDLEDPQTCRKIRQRIFQFIDTALTNHRSVLILSDTNQFRSVIVAAIYIIMKYRWSTVRTLEFILSKKEDIQITAELISTLQKIEADVGQR